MYPSKKNNNIIIAMYPSQKNNNMLPTDEWGGSYQGGNHGW